MKKGKDKYLYYLAGVVILCLIGVQVYWITRSICLQKSTQERQLKEDIDNVVKEVEESAYCFTFYSKAYLEKEGIYILRQNFQDGKFVPPAKGGRIDTLDMYNIFYDEKDTSFYKDRTIGFSEMAGTVDISLKFTFTGAANPFIKKDTSTYNISNLNTDNYREVLASKFKVNEAIDVNLLDNMIKAALKKNGFDTVYKAGIRKQGDTTFEYLLPGSQPNEFMHSSIKATFLENRFDRPYEVLLTVPDSYKSIIKAMFLMMFSSGIIIIILILSYAYFVRTILNQKKLSAMKNTFINNITHEFRTPITNIKLAVENWHESKRNDELYMKIIAEENDHMERNVEQILKIATLENGKEHTDFSHVNLYDVLHETVNSFDIRLNKVKGTVFLNMKGNDIYLYGDKALLKNMFANLIDNAIKYSNSNLEISINARRIDGMVEVDVEDNGIGMLAETQKHIFNRFYRGEMGDRHDVKGFGLGLSYVKYIVQLHKGEITVKTKEHEGTKFSIRIPS
jgi:signal transduction histidine kinase